MRRTRGDTLVGDTRASARSPSSPTRPWNDRAAGRARCEARSSTMGTKVMIASTRRRRRRRRRRTTKSGRLNRPRCRTGLVAAIRSDKERTRTALPRREPEPAHPTRSAFRQRRQETQDRGRHDERARRIDSAAVFRNIMRQHRICHAEQDDGIPADQPVRGMPAAERQQQRRQHGADRDAGAKRGRPHAGGPRSLVTVQ